MQQMEGKEVKAHTIEKIVIRTRSYGKNKERKKENLKEGSMAEDDAETGNKCMRPHLASPPIKFVTRPAQGNKHTGEMENDCIDSECFPESISSVVPISTPCV